MRRNIANRSGHCVPLDLFGVGQEEIPDKACAWVTEVILLSIEVDITVNKFSTLEYVVHQTVNHLSVYLIDIYFLRDGKTIDVGTILASHAYCSHDTD
jgi:hypothetical protein